MLQNTGTTWKSSWTGVHSLVGIDSKEIQKCVLHQKDSLLQHELENPAWSPRAIRINGWRYSGMLEADLVARAVCSGFIHVLLGFDCF
eukprot:g11755.t1